MRCKILIHIIYNSMGESEDHLLCKMCPQRMTKITFYSNIKQCCYLNMTDSETPYLFLAF